jgi:hypothetical protein
MCMLASGIVRLAEQLRSEPTVRMPYPVPLQRALDRISAMCLAVQATPPRSAMELLDWASRPFENWPFRLRVEGMDPGEVLLAHGEPSKACLEWAVFSGDVEAEVREHRLLNAVLDKCRAHDRPDVYVAFRLLLVERPAMSERDLTLQLARPELALIAKEVRAAYRPAPPETAIEGYAAVCGGCRNLRIVGARGGRVCQEWDCPDPVSEAERLPVAEGVVWLSRELRMFVAGPGRAELRIARSLEDKGIKVQLWPAFDACDVLPEGLAWPADVKSWGNPVRLARRLTKRPFRPPPGSERGFIVIAKEQTTGRPDYVRAVRHHCQWLRENKHVEVVTEQTYVNRVVARLRGRVR